MLVGLRELLEDASARHAAVGAFTAYNAETADAVLRAAERRGCGVMLLVSSQAFRSPIGATLVAALHGAAERTTVPCCLQLDHERDLAAIEAALERGFGAVMADGSQLPLDENAAFVRAAVELAEPHGASVEAELGRVAGDEEIAAAVARGALTDPAQAESYVRDTGAACLAVSIGNVHGRYRQPPSLDWERLDRIRAAVPVPLTLHGASGIPGNDIRQAVLAGIVKINVNTELRDRFFEVLLARSPALQEGAQLLRLTEELSEALAQVVEYKLRLFGS
jgi:ketose-bisphosphate aldolase